MNKLYAETEVSVEILFAHLIGCGLEPVAVPNDMIRLRTSSGIGYRVGLREDQKFIQIGTYLPLDRRRDRQCKWDLAHRLNEELMLPSCYVDEDGYGDLWIKYVMPYQHGLIGDQFEAIIERFASMLQFIVETYNEDGIIDFGVPDHPCSDGSLSIPKGVLIN